MYCFFKSAKINNDNRYDMDVHLISYHSFGFGGEHPKGVWVERVEQMKYIHIIIIMSVALIKLVFQ